ncbi:MAG: hypothetical protein II897_05265 [Clostridia bacterium]|nr:hypothetical protein [Clostridia bacterium]
MKTRKIFALLLAALFILAAVPAWAVIGSEIHNTTYQGANVLREGKALSKRITASMNLSFTPGVQHMPESDYTCRATFTYYNLYGIPVATNIGTVGNLSSSCMTVVNASLTSKVKFRYYIINTDVLTDSPVYTDTVQ